MATCLSDDRLLRLNAIEGSVYVLAKNVCSFKSAAYDESFTEITLVSGEKYTLDGKLDYFLRKFYMPMSAEWI